MTDELFKLQEVKDRSNNILSDSSVDFINKNS